MNSRLRASSMWLTAFNFFTLAELFSDVTVDVLCDAFTAAVPAVVDWSPAAGASPLAAVSCWSDWVVVTGMTSAASDFLAFSVAFTAGTASSPAFLSLLTVAVVEAGVLWVSSLIFCFQKRENGYYRNKSSVWTRPIMFTSWVIGSFCIILVWVEGLSRPRAIGLLNCKLAWALYNQNVLNTTIHTSYKCLKLKTLYASLPLPTL